MEGHKSCANEGNAPTINPWGRDILIPEDRSPISRDVDRDIPALRMVCYFDKWIDKKKSKIIKVLWGDGPGYFPGILPPMPPKTYVDIVGLMYLSGGDEETSMGLCEVLSCHPLDKGIQRTFFGMVVRPLYKLSACSQEDIKTVCNDPSIRKGLKLILGFIRPNSGYEMCFLLDTKLVYSLFLCYNEMPILRDLIGEMSSHEIKIDEAGIDVEDGIDLSWMDDISKDLTTQSINDFDNMISKDCPVVRLLSNHEKLWLRPIASFINGYEFESSVAYVLRVVLLSKVVPVTVYTFIFFDMFISKLERLTMSRGCGYNEYLTLRNVFRGLVLLLSLDKDGLSSNLKGYYHEKLDEENSDEMSEITFYSQGRFRRVLSARTWNKIFLIMKKRNAALGSADFSCILEVLGGVSALSFGERISEMAGRYCDIYGLRRNQIKRDDDGVIFFNLNEPSGIRQGLGGCRNRNFEKYSISLFTDYSSWIRKCGDIQLSMFLYSRSVGPSFLLRKKHFYETIKKKFQRWELHRLEIDRGNLLRSSYKEVMGVGRASQFREFDLEIKFKDELGIDAGGLSKEWFSILGEEMMKFRGMLFAEPNNPGAGCPASEKDPHGSSDCLEHFDRFVGRVMGLAVLRRECMGLSFPLVVYRFLLFDECNVRDLMDLDPVFFRGIFSLRKVGDPKSLYLSFTFPVKVNGRAETGVPMKENGENIEVTEDNLEEYIEKSARFRVIYGRAKDRIWGGCGYPQAQEIFHS
jgi:hypothetical protein